MELLFSGVGVEQLEPWVGIALGDEVGKNPRFIP
jgi:hypothetical protein